MVRDISAVMPPAGASSFARFARNSRDAATHAAGVAGIAAAAACGDAEVTSAASVMAVSISTVYEQWRTPDIAARGATIIRPMSKLLLGIDIGSSFVKASLVDVDTGLAVASAAAPSSEMAIAAPQPGWAEQDPADWWRNAVAAVRGTVERAGVRGTSVAAIGVSYQMHGLVVVDRHQRVLRPAIIWCDGRAVEIGQRAFEEIGRLSCLARLLNSPGNFTASKLRWVKEHEPDVFAAVDKAMLPGDYIAMRLTGCAATTASGLSEGIFWDYLDGSVSADVLDVYGLPPSMIPDIVPTFGVQGSVTADAATELGIAPGTPVAYRAGDQPNNAFSLRVLEPGEIAATAGTSGVVYGVGDRARWDNESRVNTFLHVNHRAAAPRYGVLLCVNGTGSLNSWIKRMAGQGLDYDEMNRLALGTPIGADGIVVLPFGNGAERTLDNRDPGAAILNLSFNRHMHGHLFRAAQEGIAFALNHGVDIMREMGIQVNAVRAGRANLFLSPLFARAFADTADAVVELFETDGAQGAARAAGVGAGIFPTLEDAFGGLQACARFEPDPATAPQYREAYQRWREALAGHLRPRG
jgi:xylulokinase